MRRPARWYGLSYEKGVSMSVTASQARQRLFPLIEQVNDDQEAVEIVSKKGTAYLVSENEYRSLRETAYLLASPANAERLRQSLAEVRAGQVTEHELLD
jgi:antitoxin YefM